MKKYLSLVFLLFTAMFMHADDINRQQAKQIAEDFFANRGIEMLDNGNSGMKKAAARDNATAPYHVFNAGSNKGFVIVSGSDVTEQILGYTDSGTFDEENMPENMKAWLLNYSEQIRWVEDNKSNITQASKSKRKISQARHSVAPLLTCTWNQGDPYNLSCPDYYNEDGTTGRPASGCSATALAQVMYFYKYPSETKAAIPAHSNSYNTTNGTKLVTMPAIPAGTKIDWDNMLDSYNGGETEAQRKAVGDLMLYVGQSVEMGYGPQSGAFFYNTEKMFEQYFGYSDGARYIYHQDYSIQEWFDLMYNEIAAGYPIAYVGYSTGGGHAFVLDGFDGEGLFHVNWGWGGGSNGWFRLNVLNPGDNSGIGASSSADGFSMGHSALIGVRVNNDGYVDPKEEYLTVVSAGLRGKTSVRGTYKNNTGKTGTYETAIVTTGDKGGFAVVSNIETVEIQSGASKSFFYDLSESFTQPGEYRLTPAARQQGQSEWIPLWRLNGNCIIATVDEDLNMSLEMHYAVENIEITNWNIKGNLAKGNNQEVEVTFRNLGDEYSQEIHLYASPTATIPDNSTCRTLVRLKRGETANATFYFEPNEAGTWNLWLKKGNTQYGTKEVEITETASQQNEYLRLSSFNIQNGGYGNLLSGTVSIQNMSTKTFTGTVRLNLWVLGEDDSGLVWSCGSQIVSFEELEYNQTQAAPFLFENLEVGRTYFISADYTSRSGAIENSGIVWNNSWELKPGILRWSNRGVITGSAYSSSMTFGTTFSGALFDGVSPTTITQGKNTNILYAFINGATVPEGIEGRNIVIEDVAESINLVNSYSFYSPVRFTANKATFSYTFKTTGDGEKGWEAMTLLFKPTSVTIDGAEATWKTDATEGDFWLREFSYQDNSGNVVFADVQGIESLRAGTPYVICATEKLAGKTVVFHGENVEFNASGENKLVVSTDDFLFYGATIEPRMADIYVLNDAGDAFEYAERNTNVKAFSCYFKTTLPEESRPQSIKITGNATGISDVNTDKQYQDDRTYDMQGRIVKTPTNGIYIKNGRKFVK